VKLRIGDIDYDYQTAMRRTPLGILMDLKSQGGPGRQTIELGLDTLDAGFASDDAGVLDDDRVLLAMTALIFLCKRNAGEPITWEQARGHVWPADVRFVPEESDVPAPDPQVASGEASQPDAETPNVKRSPKKTPAKGTPKT
jgi:hypothetical protein